MEAGDAVAAGEGLCRYLYGLPADDHLFALVAYHAAPTVTGLKPATMLSFIDGAKALRTAWDRRGAEVRAALGLESFELRRGASSSTVLLYRRAALSLALAEPEAAAMLAAEGYGRGARPEDSLERYLGELSRRFADGCPHEVGLFLGIPAVDVRSFQALRGSGCSHCGYWKVYHRPEAALRLFAAFDGVRRSIGEAILSGSLGAPWSERRSA